MILSNRPVPRVCVCMCSVLVLCVSSSYAHGQLMIESFFFHLYLYFCTCMILYTLVVIPARKLSYSYILKTFWRGHVLPLGPQLFLAGQEIQGWQIEFDMNFFLLLQHVFVEIVCKCLHLVGIYHACDEQFYLMIYLRYCLVMQWTELEFFLLCHWNWVIYTAIIRSLLVE